MVGGGLSSTPHYAQSLRVFVPEDKIATQMPDIFRHVAHIFRDADSLRYKRKRARLKFLVADNGWQWFRDELERRLGYQLEHDESVVNPRGALHTDHMGVGEQKDGLYYVGIPVERGRWSSDQMVAVADLVESYAVPGKGEVRLSQKQNVLLTNVPKENVDALSRELENIGLPPQAPLWRESLVSCTGTQFCNLAVVETKQRAYDILKYLEEEVELDTPVMVSVTGCPNACSQYQIADIGLTGTKSLWQGEKVDAYDVLVGGCLGENPEFGQQIVQKVPSPVVHKVIRRIVENYMTNRIVDVETHDAEPFRDFVGRTDVAQLRKWAEIPEWQAPPPKAPKAVPAAVA
jgi:sulfite reductase (ferredoxin)